MCLRHCHTRERVTTSFQDIGTVSRGGLGADAGKIDAPHEGHRLVHGRPVADRGQGGGWHNMGKLRKQKKILKKWVKTRQR